METEETKPKNEYGQILKSFFYIILSWCFLQFSMGLNVSTEFFIYSFLYGTILSFFFTLLILGFKYFRGKLDEINMVLFIESFNRISSEQSKIVSIIGLIFLISNMI